MSKDDNTVGKYTYKIIAINRPSEEACLKCRKLVTELMNEKFNKSI